MKKQAVLSLSGGMDSSTLLLHLLNTGYEVTCLSFDYGQKHRVELERAQSLVDYLNDGYNLDSNTKSNYSFNYFGRNFHLKCDYNYKLQQLPKFNKIAY